MFYFVNKTIPIIIIRAPIILIILIFSLKMKTEINMIKVMLAVEKIG